MAKKEQKTVEKIIVGTQPVPQVDTTKVHPRISPFSLPTKNFTKALASEIVKNLATFGKMTVRPFQYRKRAEKKEPTQLGEYPVLIDTSVLIDGRILPIVNSGFLVGTLLVPNFVLEEIQHIADSADSLRRAKGRRGLEVVSKLKSQKANNAVKVKIMSDDLVDIKEVDHKLVALAKKWRDSPSGKQIRLLTVDFNLAQLARASGVKVLNVNDLSQAIKVAVIAGEELTIRITHIGKERRQGVGYLPDGTMVVVEDAADRLNMEIAVIITKIHQTPAGQLFFARLK